MRKAKGIGYLTRKEVAALQSCEGLLKNELD